MPPPDWCRSKASRLAILSCPNRNKRVTNTFIALEQKIFEVLYWLKEEPDTEYSLFATDNHPFWINETGWTRADEIERGNNLQLADERGAYVVSAHPVHRTSCPNICWSQSTERGDDGRLLDFSNDYLIVGDAQYVRSLMPDDGADQYFRATVYNLEVDDFHTYYVGLRGVWVHNEGCDGQLGLRTADGKETVPTNTINSTVKKRPGAKARPERPRRIVGLKSTRGNDRQLDQKSRSGTDCRMPQAHGMSLRPTRLFRRFQRSFNPIPSSIRGSAFSTRDSRVADCFAPVK